MLDGDMSSFITAFDADYIEDKKGQNWTLQATPKISAIKDFLSSMTLAGNTKDLKQMVISYKNGTMIIINFKRMKTESADEIKC